jgi:pyridoxamine 5'-phosphate oxidase family protein
MKGVMDMSIFTKNELEYIGEQRLGRLATVDVDGNPHVVPVGFRHNPDTDTIEIGGHDLVQTKKWRDVGGHPRVAFVVDDVLPPWRPRSIEILADAELLESGGEGFARGLDPQIIRLHPVKVIAWGIDEKRQSRKIENIEVNTNKNHVIV